VLRPTASYAGRRCVPHRVLHCGAGNAGLEPLLLRAVRCSLLRRLTTLLAQRSERLEALGQLQTTAFYPQQRNGPLRHLSLVFPPPSLCTDNGLMVAWTGVEKLLRGISDPVEGQEPVPRWPIGATLSAEDKEVMSKLKKLMSLDPRSKRSVNAGAAVP
jgi:hypothetical protein